MTIKVYENFNCIYNSALFYLPVFLMSLNSVLVFFIAIKEMRN